jgi:hypothetical protein
MHFVLPMSARKQTLNIDVRNNAASQTEMQILVGDSAHLYQLNGQHSVHTIGLNLFDFPQWEKGSQTVTFRAMKSLGSGKISLIGLELV